MYDHYPLGKYNYKRLTTVIANSPDIFEQKMKDLFHGFDFIRAYIDDLLDLSKGDCPDHVQKLELTLNKIKEKDLNITPKSLS